MQENLILLLLITGQNNHDWEHTSKTIEGFLSPRFDVVLTTNPAVSLVEQDLGAFDAFFLDYNGERWGFLYQSPVKSLS